MKQISKSTRFVKLKMPKLVFLFGLASFFNDIASKMVFPLLPVYLIFLGVGRMIGLFTA